jgi:hypothetical protein
VVSTTIKISESAMSDLRSIAAKERRSVGFLIRDAVTFWLTEHARQEAERTGNMQEVSFRRDHTVQSISQPPSEQPIRVGKAALKTDTSEGKK